MRGATLAHELAHCYGVGRFAPPHSKSAGIGDRTCGDFASGADAVTITPHHAMSRRASRGRHLVVVPVICVCKAGTWHHLADIQLTLPQVRRPSLHLLTISRRLLSIVRAQFAVCITQLQADSRSTVLTPTQTADSQQSRSHTLHGCTLGPAQRGPVFAR